MIKRLIKRSLRYLNLWLPHRVNNAKFIVPVISAQGLLNLKEAEHWASAVLKVAMSVKPGAVIDIGVNVGQTLLKVAAIDRNVTYYGFEPNYTCTAYVKNLIDANRLETFHVFPFGLGAVDEVVELYLRKGQTETASVIKGFRPEEFYSTSISVLLRKGDSVLSDLVQDEISIIKIDVEGAELEVVKGLEDTIEHKQPILLLEVLPDTNRANYRTGDAEAALRSERRLELMSFFKKRAYTVFQIESVTSRITMAEEFSRSADVSDSNYLLVPENHMDTVRHALYL